MIRLDDDCKLAFCVGVGGVGKTTFAASLALQEALRGRSVLVLTADPARRLADALGIRGLRNVPSDVPLSSGGELHAAMLETKASADDIIRRAAADPARAQRVLDNRIYQAFSNTLARSHAYAAMERVYEAVHDSRFDLVVVDTPPSQSSIEILDAPARLVRFLDQRVVRWFLSASSLDLGGRPTESFAQRLLRRVAGDSLVSALTEFLGEMSFLREGFAERAEALQSILRSSSTSFVLVSSADSVGLEAARSVASEVTARGFGLAHVVFNRAFLAEIDPTMEWPALPPRLAWIEPKLVSMRRHLAAEQARKDANIRAFRARYAAPTWSLPEATRPLGDRSALAEWVKLARPLEVES